MTREIGPKAAQALFSTVVPAGAAEQIVRRLSGGIRAGLIAPGERLPSESDLARSFGVAPMTVRQALVVLRSEGYIETRRGRHGGSYVRADVTERILHRAQSVAISPEELRELTDWRRAISGEAAALAAERIAAGKLEPLKELLSEAGESVEDGSVYRVLDARFHLLVAETSGSKRLVSAETQIQAELDRMLAFAHATMEVRALALGGHYPILSHIESADPLLARESMVRHVESTFDLLIGICLGEQSAAPPSS